jgi:hypothetical protein
LAVLATDSEMKLAPESPKEVVLESSEEISPESKELAPESPHSSLLVGAMEIPSYSLPDFVPDSLAPESMELVAPESKELAADSEELLAPDSLPPGSEPTVPHSNSVTMVPYSMPLGAFLYPRCHLVHEDRG